MPNLTALQRTVIYWAALIATTALLLGIVTRFQ